MLQCLSLLPRMPSTVTPDLPEWKQEDSPEGPDELDLTTEDLIITGALAVLGLQKLLPCSELYSSVTKVSHPSNSSFICLAAGNAGRPPPQNGALCSDVLAMFCS